MGRGSAAQRTGARRGTTQPRRSPARPAGRAPLPRPWLVLAALVALGAVVALALALRADRGADGALAMLDTSDFHALAFSPADPNVVFFGHHNGIRRSDDGGKTWTTLVDRSNFDAMGLAVSHADPRRMYLAGHNIFQVSTNGGASWQPVAHNLPGSDIHGFAMNPDDASRLWALVAGQGLFGSTDGGQTWQRLPAQLPADIMAVTSAGGSPETLYAGSTSAGLLRSTDGGRTWGAAANGLASRNVLALAIDPVARRTVYAGVEGGLHKSMDGGDTWSRLAFPGDTPVALAVSPAQPGRVLAISVKARQGLVYRSDDGGQSWGAGR